MSKAVMFNTSGRGKKMGFDTLYLIINKANLLDLMVDALNNMDINDPEAKDTLVLTLNGQVISRGKPENVAKVAKIVEHGDYNVL